MTGIDGYEVCERIKQMKLLLPPKVILVSGKAMIEERIKGYTVGADDYLTKPFNDDEFSAKVKVFARLIRAEKGLKTLNQTLEAQVEIRTKQLLSAEKMAMLGSHVAEIVHNLKNPLTIIKASASNLTKMMPGDKNVERVHKGCEKLHAIIKSILIGGTGAAPTSQNQEGEININDIIKNEIELLKGNVFLTKEVSISLLLESTKTIKAIPTHFSQIITNLCGNALDALHEVKGREKKLIVTTKDSDDSLKIIIEDTGPGIPADYLAKIYDPFFTTKPIEAKENEPTGTGLGLSSVKKMVESYSGTITVDTEVGKGTTFTLTLPATKRS